MHRGSRVCFSDIPGIPLGGLRNVNYGHDVDVLWKCGGDGLIPVAGQKEAIGEFDPQLKRSFVLFCLEGGETGSGFIFSASSDVSIYKEHDRLDPPSHKKLMGF